MCDIGTPVAEHDIQPRPPTWRLPLHPAAWLRRLLWGDDGIRGRGGLFSCGMRPRPGSGAYGHWWCQRWRWHRGPHRYRNYIQEQGSNALQYNPLPVHVRRPRPWERPSYVYLRRLRWHWWLPGRVPADVHVPGGRIDLPA